MCGGDWPTLTCGQKQNYDGDDDGDDDDDDDDEDDDDDPGGHETGTGLEVKF